MNLCQKHFYIQKHLVRCFAEKQNDKRDSAIKIRKMRVMAEKRGSAGGRFLKSEREQQGKYEAKKNKN